ncbi:MAG TPA: nuclear transport factor 2 family protein [Anaeromyxobacter sp.]
MTNRLLLTLAVPLALLLSAACSPARIPGTEIADTRENRAVYDVIGEYVKAMNKRDADAVLALVAPDYFDDAGTPDPGDDLDRERLEKVIKQDLGRVETEKLGVSLRKIEVQDGAAFAEIFYDNYYRVQTPAGAIPRRDSDVHRIRLKKIDGKWKIAAGL